jgi:hypothetical protein
VIAKQSREGWFQCRDVTALEPPRRFAPPLLTQEGSRKISSHYSAFKTLMLNDAAKIPADPAK